MNGKFHKVESLGVKLQFTIIIQTYYFSVEPFYVNYWTLDSLTNAIISYAVAHPSSWLPKI